MSLSHRINQKMWFIYTLEYYSTIKNEDMINFSGKWMKLENILSEVTIYNPKGHEWYILTDKWILAKNTTHRQYEA